MNEGRLNLGFVADLLAESFGEPGSRTFRLHARTESGEVSIWLEKEQLVALGGAAQQILERVSEGQGVNPRPVMQPAHISGEVAAHAGSMSLGFDSSQNGFVLEATELWDTTLEVSAICALASRDQLSQLESQVDSIVAAGRPRCSMCGRPLGPGPHFCPPSNGHAAILREGRA